MGRIAALLVLLNLAACNFGPVVTTNPLDDEEAAGQVVSVCYTSANTTREEIMALAEERCSVEGSSVEIWKTNLILNECPVFLKRRVAFVCVPPADETAPVRVVPPLADKVPGAPGTEVPGTTEGPFTQPDISATKRNPQAPGY